MAARLNRLYQLAFSAILVHEFIALSGCVPLSPQTINASTNGFHHSLPLPDTRIVIWGASPAVTGTATIWLQKRGLRVVERAKIQQILEEQRVRLTHTADDEGSILRVGKLLGAGMIVFADASVTSGAISNFSVNAYGGGGGSTTIHSESVSIRGVDIETSEVLWTGVAQYPQGNTSAPDNALVKLTCQALATAWGFRPTGQHDISSLSMCEVDKPIVFPPSAES